MSNESLIQIYVSSSCHVTFNITCIHTASSSSSMMWWIWNNNNKMKWLKNDDEKKIDLHNFFFIAAYLESFFFIYFLQFRSHKEPKSSQSKKEGREISLWGLNFPTHIWTEANFEFCCWVAFTKKKRIFIPLTNET